MPIWAYQALEWTVSYGAGLDVDDVTVVGWTLESDTEVYVSFNWPKSNSHTTVWLTKETPRGYADKDLSGCAYYRGVGTCSYGCREEPSCQTDEPIDGWPQHEIEWIHE